MDIIRNRRWIIPFKKFGRLRINSAVKQYTASVLISQNTLHRS